MKPLYSRSLKRNAAWVSIAVVLACGSMPAAGQETGTADADVAAAIASLDRMGAYLRTLKAFRVTGTIQQEHVLDSGLKIQFTEVASLAARPPDRLLTVVSSDLKERLFTAPQ